MALAAQGGPQGPQSEAKLAEREALLAQVTIDQAVGWDHLSKLREEVDKAQASHAQHVSEATA